MNEHTFNPFEDRLSRDIRNELSRGLALAVETGSRSSLTEIATKYRKRQLAACYRTYLEDRCISYEKALRTIGAGITDPFHRSLVLWDLRLFFEVHEVLEHAWYTAQGDIKLTMQALIRAAGVYIKREYGYYDSAARLAAKAIPVLQKNRTLLVAYFDPDPLISCLADPEAPPPKLLRSE